MRRLLPLGTLLVLLTAFALALAACGDDEEQPTSAQPTVAELGGLSRQFPLAVRRSDGRQLTIPEVPQRIASLSPGATEVPTP
jgi:ABC-type Fe3+-hydroxamate transport system substrate-binding protein